MPAPDSPAHPLLQRLLAPGCLALVVSLANAAKPVAIDDTAYLSFARQIAAHPFDPYGFTLFWWTVPDDAFEILAPPVVPYWLALGVRLFGESPPLLKLWMFPFVWLLAWSVRALLRRFAPGSESRFLPAIVLSPAVFPTVNLMLDIPALALGLASLALFVRAAERGSWRGALGAGLVAGLAMQTKYTALVVPAILGWYGLTRGSGRALVLAATAIAAAMLLFASWEAALAAKYGRSHFLYHASTRQPSGRSLTDFINDKADLVPPLAADVGCLGIGTGLMAATVLGLPRRSRLVLATAWWAGFAWICLAPAHANEIPGIADPRRINFCRTFWISSGTLVLTGLVWCAVAAAFRLRLAWWMSPDEPSPEPGDECSRADARFLAGWLLIEIVAYFALTPFGAARRVIGIVVVGCVLVAWLAVRIERVFPQRRVAFGTVAVAIAAGAVVAAIDTLDAYPEKVCAERAAARAAQLPEHRTVWFAGHWGFQYYCERAGLRQIVPGVSVLQPGDVLVLPIYPDDIGFYRPHIAGLALPPPEWAASLVEEVVWEDFLSAQTIPNFYGGVDPVTGRDAPRLRVGVYCIVREWRPAISRP